MALYVVTGGAFNGKKDWVLAEFVLTSNRYEWFDLYKYTAYEWLPVTELENNIIVIQGIEQGLKQTLANDKKDASHFFNQYLLPLLKWEEVNVDRKVIIIGTDITKGVVPLNQETREWRDETGRLYQQLYQNAEEVHRIWFGISQQLKSGRS